MCLQISAHYLKNSREKPKFLKFPDESNGEELLVGESIGLWQVENLSERVQRRTNPIQRMTERLVGKLGTASLKKKNRT